MVFGGFEGDIVGCLMYSKNVQSKRQKQQKNDQKVKNINFPGLLRS